MSTSFKNLKNIPYLDVENLNGRVAYLGPFLSDNNQWDLWIKTNEKGLIKLKVIDIDQAIYFAKMPHKDKDGYFHFYDLFSQQLNFPSIQPAMHGLLSDIYNLGATLQKFELIKTLKHSNFNYTTSEISRFASTELEYYFILLRSFFDIFQEIVSKTFQIFYRKKDKSKFQQLPTKFSKMILKNNKILTREDFDNKYDLPVQIRDIYFKYVDTFLEIKNFRDLVTHNGITPDHIFISDNQILVGTNRSPFSNPNIWEGHEITDTKLGSIEIALAYFTNKTILMFEDFSSILSVIVDLPPPTVPGYKTFIRSDNNKGIIKIINLLRKSPNN